MHVSRQLLLFWWGLTVTGAYLLTEYFGHALEHGHSAVLWTWAVAMLVPVGLTLTLGRRANALAWVWAVATALLTLENFGVHGAEAKSLMPFSFHTMWFLFGAVGFGYTAAVVEGSTRRLLYAAAALLNLAGTLLLFSNPKFLDGYQFVLLALIQGVPMLLDVPLRRRHEAAGA